MQIIQVAYTDKKGSRRHDDGAGRALSPAIGKAAGIQSWMWVLHEVALVAAARLQPQHAIARGPRQRAARQVLARHVLRNKGTVTISLH